tara:strand:+ start:639 stop:881 length:243 start_codon:yes stop_codon:yes gene_type:complete
MSDLLKPVVVSDIVKDLLEYKLITKDSAVILLNAEAKANAFDNQTVLPPEWIPDIEKEETITWTIDPLNPDLPHWYTTIA